MSRLPPQINACRDRRRFASLWLTRCLVLIGCGLFAGCGYTHRELFPDEYHSVAVRMFDNRTFYREWEVDLSEALVKEIELRTPYKVSGASSAGTLLQGRIVSIDQRTLSRRRVGGLPQQLEVSVVVDFTWTDQRTGQVIRERKGFESVGRYVPAAPVGQPLEIARYEVVQRLAADIVSTMQANW